MESLCCYLLETSQGMKCMYLIEETLKLICTWVRKYARGYVKGCHVFNRCQNNFICWPTYFLCTGCNEKASFSGVASVTWCVKSPSEWWFYRSKGCSWKSKFMCKVMIICHCVLKVMLNIMFFCLSLELSVFMCHVDCHLLMKFDITVWLCLVRVVTF